jgi:hypothetical protein
VFLIRKPAKPVDHQAEAVSLREYAEAMIEDAKLALQDAHAHLDATKAKAAEKIETATRVIGRAQADHDNATVVQADNAALHEHLSAV